MAESGGVVILLASFSLVGGTATNVAERKPTWMSSQFGDRPASRAVDGDIRAGSEAYTVHTAINRTSAWWKVDLQTPVQSAKVNLYFRTDNKARRNGMQLYTSRTNSSDPKEGNLCHTVTGRPDGTDIPDVLNVNCPVTWRYLTVYTEINNDGDGAMLNFAEVQVWSTATNVAERKPTWMSSQFGNRPASRAVDGDIRAGSEAYTVHTAINRTSAWWKVDLQTPVQSAKVNLYFRTDNKARRNGMQLYTSSTNSSDPKEGNLCHTVTGRADGTDIPDVLNVTCPGTWRYLTVYTETNNDGNGAMLNFAEVQVWTCVEGMYGPNCDRDCGSRHCKVFSPTCDMTGTCPTGGCQVGWMGSDCSTVCASGTYGADCAKNCSSRQCMVSSSTCDHITGVCQGGLCKDGWIGADCTTECTSGHYGPNCRKECRLRNCNGDSSCDVILGLCKGGCVAGFKGTDCTQACTSLMYGPNCVSSCSARHCKTPSPTCGGVSGECPGGCEDGWSRIDCSSNCQGGYYGHNCSLRCADRHCTSASSCSGDGACSVECEPGWTLRDCTKECPSGTYGTNCNRTCGYCANKDACHHVTGVCADGCEAGWQGDQCQENCGKGTFGTNCESRCGNCNGTCDVVDGRCPLGCTEGYIGSHCFLKLPSAVNNGVIGGAVGLAIGIAVTLLLVGGLFMCLVKRGRLKWISSVGADPPKGTQTGTGYTDGIPIHTPTPDVKDPDYTELNDVTRERKEKSPYAVIQNHVYENNQI